MVGPYRHDGKGQRLSAYRPSAIVESLCWIVDVIGKDSPMIGNDPGDAGPGRG